MTEEELRQKCKERAKIFQQAMESCKSSSPMDCIEWFADRIAELEKDKQYFSDSLDKQIEATLKLQQENEELKKQLEDADNATDVFNAQEKRIAELEAQIEKMKCCMKCEHWYYYKSFCDKDNSYHSEGQSCKHFTLRR